jgi:aminoglycoside 6'-N-acetyltransferase
MLQTCLDETPLSPTPPAYRFRRVAEDDLPLLREWRSQPVWVYWYGEPVGDEMAEALHDNLLAMWMVELDGTPFAYAQDYDPRELPGHHFSYLPEGSRGIDQAIGDIGIVGKGHGSAVLQMQIDRLFAAGVPVIGADPHPLNARAIRAYEKAGFVVNRIQATAWGHKLLMERHRPEDD